MASKSEKHAKLDRMRSKHTKFLVLEILFVFGAIGWLFAGFYVIYVTVSFGEWFVALIVLAVLASIFEYKRKRLARKIDTAEGVLAAKES